jgi:hypothetical protein
MSYTGDFLDVCKLLWGQGLYINPPIDDRFFIYEFELCTHQYLLLQILTQPQPFQANDDVCIVFCQNICSMTTTICCWACILTKKSSSSHPRANWNIGMTTFVLHSIWNIYSMPTKTVCRSRICKRLMSPGFNSKESIPPAYVAWRAGTSNRVVVPARRAGNRLLGSLKGLQIRALSLYLEILDSGWTSPHSRIPEPIRIQAWRPLLYVLYEYLLYAYQYLLLSLYPDEQILILASPAQVHVGESVNSLATIIIIKRLFIFPSCECAIDWLTIHIPSNAHISTPFYQKTVFFSKIFFGKPHSKFLEVCLNSEYM